MTANRPVVAQSTSRTSMATRETFPTNSAGAVTPRTVAGGQNRLMNAMTRMPPPRLATVVRAPAATPASMSTANVRITWIYCGSSPSSPRCPHWRQDEAIEPGPNFPVDFVGHFIEAMACPGVTYEALGLVWKVVHVPGSARRQCALG